MKVLPSDLRIGAKATLTADIDGKLSNCRTCWKISRWILPLVCCSDYPSDDRLVFQTAGELHLLSDRHMESGHSNQILEDIWQNVKPTLETKIKTCLRSFFESFRRICSIENKDSPMIIFAIMSSKQSKIKQQQILNFRPFYKPLQNFCQKKYIKLFSNMNPNYQNVPHTHFLTETALLSCGFQQATRSSTPRQIWNIHPHGGTAMRDALLYGNGLMMQLHNILQRDSTANNWYFMHILITDGHDTDSNASYQQTFQALSVLRGDMNVRDLKIVILGVDIEFGYAQSLRNLIAAAGIHGQYHDITHTDIKHMFHRIRTNAGMNNRPMNQNINAMNNMPRAPMPASQGNQPQIQNYAVLFTLDISGSMSGHKWEVTRHATVDFIRYLGPNDLVSAIVFNDNPHLVMHWNTRQNQMKLGQMGTVRPFEQVMRNQAYFDPYEFGQGPPVTQNGYYTNNNIRQPMVGTTYVIQDPYSNNNDCCCC